MPISHELKGTGHQGPSSHLKKKSISCCFFERSSQTEESRLLCQLSARCELCGQPIAQSPGRAETEKPPWWTQRRLDNVLITWSSFQSTCLGLWLNYFSLHGPQRSAVLPESVFAVHWGHHCKKLIGAASIPLITPNFLFQEAFHVVSVILLDFFSFLKNLNKERVPCCFDPLRLTYSSGPNTMNEVSLCTRALRETAGLRLLLWCLSYEQNISETLKVLYLARCVSAHASVFMCVSSCSCVNNCYYYCCYNKSQSLWSS